LDTERYHIPRHLNEPMRILIFTVDEFASLTLPLLLSFIVLQQLWGGLILGSLLMMLIRKLKGQQGHYFLWQWLYWHCSALVFLRSTPPSYQRDFLG